MIVWLNTNSAPITNISLNSSGKVINVFVAEVGDIYFGYTLNSTSGIQKLTSNLTNSDSVMEICPRCYDIFIDKDNNIYCSIDDQHKILRKSLNDKLDPIQIIAGTGNAGSTSNMLSTPNGIFVDTNLDLYVADHRNNRIQLFHEGQLNGITVAGSGSLNITIMLNRPTGIVLDGNRYLFIVDYSNNRIVRNGPNEFYCLFGCNGSGPADNQLSTPRSMAFDSFGNIYVVDDANHRIQKFHLISNSCSKLN